MSSPYRAGTVAVIGRPNVGKSTLVNALVGVRVSIVTPKAQTTRHRLLGIASFPEGQLLLVGNVLARQPQPREWIGHSLNDTPVVQRILSQKESVFEMPGLDGVPSLHAVTPISDGQARSLFASRHRRTLPPGRRSSPPTSRMVRLFNSLIRKRQIIRSASTARFRHKTAPCPINHRFVIPDSPPADLCLPCRLFPLREVCLQTLIPFPRAGH
jgi:GTPase SAR1 family protein